MPRSSIQHVHVMGHPNLPLDTDAAPGDAQVLNCRNMALLLDRAGLRFTYYGLSGSRVGVGAFVDLGTATGPWAFRNAWHRTYTRRLQRALDAEASPARGPQVVLSMYGAAHRDVKAGPLPVIEPMVGYDHCWAPYRVFPSYAQQHTIYANPSPHVHGTKWFDTVIPHFLDPAEYWIEPVREDYLLFLGRDAPDKGVSIAREVAAEAGLRLVAVHDGLQGRAKTELLARARMVLMPTVYVEPFGYVAVEAQLCGVPVATTDWGAFAETVVHGRTGFRCRTLAEFVAAVHMAPRLSPARIRARAVRLYGVDAVLAEYVRYFDFVWHVHTQGGYYAPNARRWPCSAARR